MSIGYGQDMAAVYSLTTTKGGTKSIHTTPKGIKEMAGHKLLPKPFVTSGRRDQTTDVKHDHSMAR